MPGTLTNLLRILLTTGCLLLATGNSLSAPVQYKVEIDNDNAHAAVRERNGQNALFVTVQFRIKRLSDGQNATDVGKDEIVVEEDGRRVTGLDIYQPKTLDTLSTVLALDISGSMA